MKRERKRKILMAEERERARKEGIEEIKREKIKERQPSRRIRKRENGKINRDRTD